MALTVYVNGRKYTIKGDAPTNSDMYLQIGEYYKTSVASFWLWTAGDKAEEVDVDNNPVVNGSMFSLVKTGTCISSISVSCLSNLTCVCFPLN